MVICYVFPYCIFIPIAIFFFRFEIVSFMSSVQLISNSYVKSPLLLCQLDLDYNYVAQGLNCFNQYLTDENELYSSLYSVHWYMHI